MMLQILFFKFILEFTILYNIFLQRINLWRLFIFSFCHSIIHFLTIEQCDRITYVMKLSYWQKVDLISFLKSSFIDQQNKQN